MSASNREARDIWVHDVALHIKPVRNITPCAELFIKLPEGMETFTG